MHPNQEDCKLVENAANCGNGVEFDADSDEGGDDDDDDHDNDDQTHDKASRFWNRASLFVLAIWTLGDCVAPGQDDDDKNEDDVVVEDDFVVEDDV